MTTSKHHRRRCQHTVYSLTCDEFDLLYKIAKGCCQICGTPEAETTRGVLCIDHLTDYGSHMVRGLLCDKCNRLMRVVDSGELGYPGDAVYRYQYRAWCSRMLRRRLRRDENGRWTLQT